MKLVGTSKNKTASVKVSNCFEIDMNAFSEGQIAKLKHSLMFENPAYIAAKKYSRYSKIYAPPQISYFETNKGTMYAPVGADLSFLGNPFVEDCRNRVDIKPPKFLLTLRPDQQKAADRFITKNAGKEFNSLVQLPTGKGKTILALYLASVLKQRTLVVVHKTDLLTGWKKDIQLCFGADCTSGLIQAKNRRVDNFVTIATVQTLSRMDEEEFNQYTDKFGMIICDECHHCPSSMFSVVNSFNARYRLALTATPERSDGLTKVLKLYFGDFCYRYKATRDEKDILPVEVIPREIKDICITPVCAKDDRGKWFIRDIRTDPTVYKLQEGECFITALPYLQRPHFSYADYSDLIVRLAKKHVAEDIKAEYEKGHSCIAFFSLKPQIDFFAEYLNEEFNIPAADILKFYGDNSTDANEQALTMAANVRKKITLATYPKATEGTNVKQWEVAFIVSSINDGKNAEQAVGRIRRTTDKPKLKSALVYDYRFPFVYVLRNHSRTRDTRYKALGFKFIGQAPKEPQKRRRSALTRGYIH